MISPSPTTASGEKPSCYISHTPSPFCPTSYSLAILRDLSRNITRTPPAILRETSRCRNFLFVRFGLPYGQGGAGKNHSRVHLLLASSSMAKPLLDPPTNLETRTELCYTIENFLTSSLTRHLQF